MNDRVVVDAGPLVAYFDRRQSTHGWVTGAMAELHPPLLTCDAVLAEACHLLHKRFPDGVRRLESWLTRDLLRIAFSLGEHWKRTFALMDKYRDLPMSLADACLVRMVELGIGDRVFTLDEHFRIYRHSGRRVVPMLMPE